MKEVLIRQENVPHPQVCGCSGCQIRGIRRVINQFKVRVKYLVAKCNNHRLVHWSIFLMKQHPFFLGVPGCFDVIIPQLSQQSCFLQSSGLYNECILKEKTNKQTKTLHLKYLQFPKVGFTCTAPKFSKILLTVIQISHFQHTRFILRSTL